MLLTLMLAVVVSPSAQSRAPSQPNIGQALESAPRDQLKELQGIVQTVDRETRVLWVAQGGGSQRTSFLLSHCRRAAQSMPVLTMDSSQSNDRDAGRSFASGPHHAGAPFGIVAHNVGAIAALEESALAQRTPAQRLADWIAQQVGTPVFLLFHLAWLVAWILVDEHHVPGLCMFDPYPFSFLTLIVSLEAIFLTLFVLISQNRLTHQTERRSHLDLQINLLAEQESTRTVELLQRIADHLGLPRDGHEEGELATRTDIRDVVGALEATLPADS